MVQKSSVNNYLFYLAVIIICGIYLFFRLTFPDTIEFGYDQPRLAMTAIDFVKGGNFIDSQKFSLESPWGNLSWGPALIYINAFFVLISKNPIIISYAVIFFNLTSIILVIFIGKEFISKKTGILSGLILAVHPWWIIFSRMIYQPSIVPTLVVISMYCLFKSIRKPGSFWAAFLYLTWGVLLQTYLITASFVVTSFLILIYKIRLKIFGLKSVILGFLLNLVIFVPSIKYYIDNPELFRRFFEAKNKFISPFPDVFKNFLEMVSGRGFYWQLGYGYKDFLNSFANYEILSSVVLVALVILIILGILFGFLKKNYYVISISFLLFCPLWVIPFVGVEKIVPRYFLFILPFVSILLSYCLENLSIKFNSKILYIPFALVLLFWSYFSFKYNKFILNYKYGNGFLSNYSDVPYSFLDRSFRWILEDSKNKEYSEITVSNNPQSPFRFSFNRAQTYYWEYYLNKKQAVSGSGKVGHYLMYFSPAVGILKSKEFGPYVVSEAKLKN
ncbi:MAG: hypothetical protein NTZ07_00365 [Candidatus Woesebacteria bacterium]|nr:hypothetical protein [Candidatus Woesebacteria bacterium]